MLVVHGGECFLIGVGRMLRRGFASLLGYIRYVVLAFFFVFMDLMGQRYGCFCLFWVELIQ